MGVLIRRDVIIRVNANLLLSPAIIQTAQNVTQTGFAIQVEHQHRYLDFHQDDLYLSNCNTSDEEW